MDLKNIKFDDKGLIVAIAQDYLTNEVLMQAFMNEEAIKLTMETNIMHYFSRSRNKLWKKGEESGHFQKVKSISFDCDMDCLVAKIEQVGNACHTGEYSCFFNHVNEKFDNIEMLGKLFKLIEERKINVIEGSYTNFLLKKGINKIAKKMGEEAVELVIAAVNDDKEEIKCESADLIYHLLVLLSERNVSINDVCKELAERHK